MSSYSKLIIDIFEKVSPTVVSISTVRIAQGAYFHAVPVQGIGSGIIIDRDGAILTNHHIVAESKIKRSFRRSLGQSGEYT